MIGNLKGEEYLEKVIEYAPRWQALTGKVAFSLDMDGKSASLNATLRMKKGEVIQLSVAPFAGHRSGADGNHSRAHPCRRPPAQALCGDFVRVVERDAADGNRLQCLAVAFHERGVPPRKAPA